MAAFMYSLARFFWNSVVGDSKEENLLLTNEL